MIGLRSKRLITDSIIYIVLTVMVVIWLFPLVWMVLRAFDTNTSNITTSIFPNRFACATHTAILPYAEAKKKES